MSRWTLKLVVAAVGVSSACAQQDQGEELPADTLAQPAAQESAAPRTANAGSMHVVLREWAIDPQRDTVAAGTLVFHVMNEGQYQHALEVEGNGEEQETEKLPAGGTATLTVELRPGTYELYCPVEDSHGKHEELGMRTTLVVRDTSRAQ